MQGAKGLSPDQIRAFLKASEEVHFQDRNREEVYQWVSETLRLQGYRRLGRTARGLVRRYVEKMTGLSRAQIARRITQYLAFVNLIWPLLMLSFGPTWPLFRLHSQTPLLDPLP